VSISLLLDNAEPSKWRRWFGSGIFHGITTNPTLIKKAGQQCSLSNLKYLTQEAQDIGYREIHIQTWGKSIEEIVSCGFSIGNLSTSETKIYVKIPITKTGVEAANILIKSGISITFTACYEAKQVLIAASVGASYIAPYLGRINDEGRNGTKEILEMKNILKGTASKCKILVASIRDYREINYLASNGLSTFTINSKIAEDLFCSNSTMKANEIFEKDSKILS